MTTKVDNDVELDLTADKVEEEIESMYDDEAEEGGPTNMSKIYLGLKVLLFLGWLGFSIAAWVIDFDRSYPLFLMWIAALVVFALYLAFYFGAKQVDAAAAGFERLVEKIENNRVTALIAAGITIVILGVIIGLSIDKASRLISLAGMVFFIFFSYLTSWKRRQIKWRPVIGGLLSQFLFALLILRTEPGFEAFEWLGNQVQDLLKYSEDGAEFVFAYQARRGIRFTQVGGFDYQTLQYVPGPASGFNSVVDLGGIFATTILPTIIFFSSLVSILYYIGILQAIIKVIGRFLSFVLGTSASESLSAAGNIFVGQTEAPLLVRPFIKEMTTSEIHAIMTGGFATVAGGVLAAFISFGIPASHLIAASVMSAPAALAISKIIVPETEKSMTAAGVKFEIESQGDSNIIEAASNGAQAAIQLVLSIAGQLIAFIAIITMVNAWLFYFGQMVGMEGEDKLSFQKICSYIFYPVAYLMGVEGDDCFTVASLIGDKIFINEFVAFDKLAGLKGTDAISPKSVVISTYALCGFSNFASIGIQLGCLTPLAPNKAKIFSKCVFSAMIAGNTACFLTATIAGLLYKEEAL